MLLPLRHPWRLRAAFCFIKNPCACVRRRSLQCGKEGSSGCCRHVGGPGGWAERSGPDTGGGGSTGVRGGGAEVQACRAESSAGAWRRPPSPGAGGAGGAGYGMAPLKTEHVTLRVFRHSKKTRSSPVRLRPVCLSLGTEAVCPRPPSLPSECRLPPLGESVGVDGSRRGPRAASLAVDAQPVARVTCRLGVTEGTPVAVVTGQCRARPVDGASLKRRSRRRVETAPRRN